MQREVWEDGWVGPGFIKMCLGAILVSVFGFWIPLAVSVAVIWWAVG